MGYIYEDFVSFDCIVYFICDIFDVIVDIIWDWFGGLVLDFVLLELLFEVCYVVVDVIVLKDLLVLEFCCLCGEVICVVCLLLECVDDWMIDVCCLMGFGVLIVMYLCCIFILSVFFFNVEEDLEDQLLVRWCCLW